MTANAPRLTGALQVELRGRVGALPVEVALRAAPGEITAVFGPSGSGKTTLLRAVAGLTRLSGRLDAGGNRWQDDKSGVFLPPHQRSVGFGFQEPALFSHLAVEANLRYAEQRAARRNGGGASLRFEEVVERLELEAHLERQPAGLSGGELQRAALGRALLSDPAVLLLDEPLAALHQSARSRIAAWLRSLASDFGMAVLHVTHDLGEVVEAADRIVSLKAGRVTGSGPAEVMFEQLGLEHRDQRFEAGSILTATVTARREADGMIELDLHGQRLSVPALVGSENGVGEAVRLRIRARDVALATRRPEAISVRNILEGVVDEVATDPDSPFAEVSLRIGGGEGSRLRARITRDAASDLALAPGGTVFALLKSVAFDES